MLFKYFKRKQIEKNISTFIEYNTWKKECYKSGKNLPCPIPGIINKDALWMGYQDLNFLRYYKVNEILIDLLFKSIDEAKKYYYKNQKIIDLKESYNKKLNELNDIKELISEYEEENKNNDYLTKVNKGRGE